MSGENLGVLNAVQKLAKRPPAYDMATHAATGFCKPSIILFDTRPGTRSFTIPQGVTRIRAFVVGAGGDGASADGGSGGGYSEKEYLVTGGDAFIYTVGLPPGGTSSFNSEITATGGGDDGGAAGVGSGGDVNFSGGISTGGGGASSGQRHGDGIGSSAGGGAGWGGGSNTNDGCSSGGIDGFGIGMTSAPPVPTWPDSNGQFVMGYGSGAPAAQTAFIGGGGGTNRGNGGIGGGGGANANGKGGFGLVGIEVLEVE